MGTIESWDRLHARARDAEMRIATHHTQPDGGGLLVTVSTGATLVLSIIVTNSAAGDCTARAMIGAGLDAEGVGRG